MFQSFVTPSDPSTGLPRLQAVRSQMAAMGIDAFLVPHADEHQNEFLPPHAERLAWLTGFTGSAGTAIMRMDDAHLFVDGRYTLQARNQVDLAAFTPQDLIATPPATWLAEHVKKGTRVGIDAWLHTINEVEQLKSALEKAGATLIECAQNPLDLAWTDAPAAPTAPAQIHRLEYAGVLARSKLADLARQMRKKAAAAAVLTDPTSVSWAFNIRGDDVPHTPLVLAWAIVPARGRAQLFIAPQKLDTQTRAYLTQLADLHDYDAFGPALGAFAKAEKRPIMVDPARANAAVAAIIEDNAGTVMLGTDPAIGPRARKNRVERRGAIDAQRREGAAMVAFLHWLDTQEPETLDEITIVKQLETVRRQTGERLGMPLRDISFDTICGVGPNGAIVHYRVDEKSNRRVQSGDLILIDSGGQYEDGTTDITRVVATGAPTDVHKRHFTLVLKGMITISLASFPAGTRGVDIDVLARNALWAHGLDYSHGTGHGVGSYLGVHEGPQSISRRGMVPLEAGMIISNEPGCYIEGSHGIRIENLVMVEPTKKPKDGIMAVHSLRTLTLCPIDRRLIDAKRLDRTERRWLNRYHARVKRELSPLIDDAAVLDWLEKATATIR